MNILSAIDHGHVACHHHAMIKVLPVPAYKDNYIWLISRSDTSYVVIVDPGAAQPVLHALERLALIPMAILITHHHWDHTTGLAELLQHYPVPVYGPAREPVVGVSHALRGGDRVTLAEIELSLEVLDVPGHTRGAISYYGKEMLFCGDTLFTAGCGRLFEGTPEQMHASLAKLAALPDTTQVYCGHEYTLENLHFATLVEPENRAIRARLRETATLREHGTFTVPAPLGVEKRTNPFLRASVPEVIAAAEKFAGRPLKSGAEVFAVLRHWKDTVDG